MSTSHLFLHANFPRVSITSLGDVDDPGVLLTLRLCCLIARVPTSRTWVRRYAVSRAARMRSGSVAPDGDRVPLAPRTDRHPLQVSAAVFYRAGRGEGLLVGAEHLETDREAPSTSLRFAPALRPPSAAGIEAGTRRRDHVVPGSLSVAPIRMAIRSRPGAHAVLPRCTTACRDRCAARAANQLLLQRRPAPGAAPPRNPPRGSSLYAAGLPAPPHRRDQQPLEVVADLAARLVVDDHRQRVLRPARRQ